MRIATSRGFLLAWGTAGIVGCGDSDGQGQDALSATLDGSEATTSTTSPDGGAGTGSTVGATGGSLDGNTDHGTTGSLDGSSGSLKFDVGTMPPTPDLGGQDGPIIPATCAETEAGKSTVGCIFYAADLDQHDSVEGGQFAIAVANVQLTVDATVTIESKQGGTWQTAAGPQLVPALGLFTFELLGRNTDDTALYPAGAYRVVSDVPLAAYQFNPLDGTNSRTSDASMLYPVPALDTLNQVTAWISTDDGIGAFEHSYTTIIATSDGTEVSITPSVATVAGDGVPAGTAGTPFVVSMADGDVLNIANATLGTSMTGTRIESNDGHPIAVFAGQECANIPETVCCCDHLEEQLAGVRLWGTEFIASRMPVREVVAPESTLWQIYASEGVPQKSGLSAIVAAILRSGNIRQPPSARACDT